MWGIVERTILSSQSVHKRQKSEKRVELIYIDIIISARKSDKIIKRKTVEKKRRGTLSNSKKNEYQEKHRHTRQEDRN